jgi:hypothetical protein
VSSILYKVLVADAAVIHLQRESTVVCKPMQAGKLLVRPLTLPASKAAAAMDQYIAEAMACAAVEARTSGGSGGGNSSSGNGGNSASPQLGDALVKSAVAVAAQKSAGELAGLPDQAGSIPQPLNEASGRTAIGLAAAGTAAAARFYFSNITGLVRLLVVISCRWRSYAFAATCHSCCLCFTVPANPNALSDVCNQALSSSF